MKKTETDRLLKEMREATERAADALGSIIESSEAAQKQHVEVYKRRAELDRALEPLVRTQEEIAELAEPAGVTAEILEDARKQTGFFERLQPSWLRSILPSHNSNPLLGHGRPILNIHDGYYSKNIVRAAQAVSAYQLGLHRAVLPAYSFVNESLYRMPGRMREALMKLAKHGWFLDFKMPVPRVWKLDAVLGRGEVSEAEEILTEYFRGRLGAIQEELAMAYPHRTRFLAPAFEAHGRGEYTLAIPAFLAQANGICKEITSMRAPGSFISETGDYQKWIPVWAYQHSGREDNARVPTRRPELGGASRRRLDGSIILACCLKTSQVHYERF